MGASVDIGDIFVSLVNNSNSRVTMEVSVDPSTILVTPHLLYCSLRPVDAACE